MLAGKSNLALLSPRGLASKPGIEPTAAEPHEDELGGSRLACLSSVLATCSLLLASASSSLLLASASSSLLLASASSLLVGTSGMLIEELLAAGSLLLASASSLLVGTSGLLIDELLAAGSLLLASVSDLFLDETEAMVLVRPQFVDGSLPIPVRAVCACASPMKNGPPKWRQRQQSGSLLVFTDGSLKPTRGGGCDHLNCSHQEGLER
jgi:hypothetical protein